MTLQHRKARWQVWAALVLLTGCGGKEALLPPSGETMLGIYQRHSGRQSSAALLEQRSLLRRPLRDDEPVADPCLRDALTEITGQFRRLANPDLVLFSYPHLTTEDAVPIPGYVTVFPLYEDIHYALPGEPREVLP